MQGAGVLGQANREWASRPADQSFLSLEELHAAVEKRTAIAVEVPGVSYGSLRTQAKESSLELVGETNRPAKFTHWSFGQFCSLLGAPAKFLRELPATLVSQVLNNRMAAKAKRVGSGKLLLEQNGGAKIRAFTGEGYARIWDMEITSRLLGMAERGWQPAPETELPQAVEVACSRDEYVCPGESCEDCGGTGKVSVSAKTRGLYASDKDVFAFLVDNSRRVFEQDPNGGLSRGVMVANSEVGDKSFWVMTFLYQYVCGNHNIWGVEGVQELRIRHVGDAAGRAFQELEVELRAYMEASSQEDEAKILRCKAKELGKTKEEVLNAIFAMNTGLAKGVVKEGQERAEMHESWYGAPNSAWAMGCGITEVARDLANADARVEVERGAKRVFEEGF